MPEFLLPEPGDSSGATWWRAWWARELVFAEWCDTTRAATEGALAWIPSEVLSEVEVIAGDIRDPESAAAALEGCEVIFHLAALIAIPYSYVNPRDYFETNVLGNAECLAGVQKCGGRACRAHLDLRGVWQPAGSFRSPRDIP